MLAASIGRWLHVGRGDVPFDRDVVEQARVHDQLLEGDRPTVPVRTFGRGCDGRDELSAERLAVARVTGLDDGGAEPEHPGLPWGLQDELAVASGWSGNAVDVEQICLHSRA